MLKDVFAVPLLSLPLYIQMLKMIFAATDWSQHDAKIKWFYLDKKHWFPASDEVKIKLQACLSIKFVSHKL